MDTYSSILQKAKQTIIHDVQVIKVKTKPCRITTVSCDGLIDWVGTFEKTGYVENYLQSIFHAGLGDKREGATLVVGTDGRYYSDIVLQTTIKMAAANGISKLYIGQFGVMTTPAISLAIREKKADAGIVISGGLYPGGTKQLFGIKLNLSDGAAAGEPINEKIHKMATSITEYDTCSDFNVKLNRLGQQLVNAGEKRTMTVDIFDSVREYAKAMDDIFDFWHLRALFSGSITGTPLRILLDGRNGAAGFYLLEVFRERLGVFSVDHRRFKHRENFGGYAPNPNSDNCEQFKDEFKSHGYDLGASFSADGTKALMICGKTTVLSNSDALALFAMHLNKLPGYRKGIKGIARTLCTSSAVDNVAKELNIPCYVTSSIPQYYNRLMNENKISICGDEQQGVTGDHVREYDGIWCVLAWLSVYAFTKRSLEKNLTRCWKSFGRNVIGRIVIENSDVKLTNKVVSNLNVKIKGNKLISTVHQVSNTNLTVIVAETFCCFHPAVEKKPAIEGIQIVFNNGLRLIYQASLHTKQESTLHVWVDAHSSDSNSFGLKRQQVIRQYLTIALQLIDIDKRHPVNIA